MNEAFSLGTRSKTEHLIGRSIQKLLCIDGRLPETENRLLGYSIPSQLYKTASIFRQLAITPVTPVGRAEAPPPSPIEVAKTAAAVGERGTKMGSGWPFHIGYSQLENRRYQIHHFSYFF